MDVMNPKQRYKAMLHNRGRTQPEVRLASALWRQGLRYLTDAGYSAKYGKSLIGRPDVIFTRKRTLLFVDGCFWHGCATCDRYPRQSKFWREKIEKNIQRDQKVTNSLELDGWQVVRVPEHCINSSSRLAETVGSLTELLWSIKC